MAVETSSSESEIQYVVYIRSMINLGRRSFPELFYQEKGILAPVRFFNSYNSAKTWLLINGASLDLKFRSEVSQGCVFMIRELATIQELLSEFSLPSLNDTGILLYDSFVFSEISRQMIVKENYILTMLDWGHPINTNIYNVNDGKVEYALSVEDVKQCCESFTTTQTNEIIREYQEKLEKFSLET